MKRMHYTWEMVLLRIQGYLLCYTFEGSLREPSGHEYLEAFVKPLLSCEV
jgi:hypothetical protein